MSDNDFDTVEHTVIPDLNHQTKKLNYSEALPLLEEREPLPHDIKIVPWRIALVIVETDIQIIFNLTQPLMLGRIDSSSDELKSVDLSAYDAHKHGVSRRHAVILAHDNIVVIRDLGSANGTSLNAKRLRPDAKYALRNADIIKLGNLEMRFNLVYNPFSL